MKSFYDYLEEAKIIKECDKLPKHTEYSEGEMGWKDTRSGRMPVEIKSKWPLKKLTDEDKEELTNKIIKTIKEDVASKKLTHLRGIEPIYRQYRFTELTTDQITKIKAVVDKLVQDKAISTKRSLTPGL